MVIDFLWGHPAELLINTFIPKEAGFATRALRYIQIGDMDIQQVPLSDISSVWQQDDTAGKRFVIVP